jgi:hypothetical protein
VVDHVTPVFAMSKLARARPGKDIGPLQCFDALEGGVGRIARSGHHHHLVHPRRRLEVFEPLTEQDMLMAFACRSDRGHGTWETKAVPAGDQHDHITAEGIGGRCTLTRHVPQGVRMAPRGFVRRVAQEKELAISSWREGPSHLIGHARHHGVRVPFS